MRRRIPVLILGLVAVIAASCSDSEGTSGASASAAASDSPCTTSITPGMSSDSVRAALLAETSNYRYGAARSPQGSVAAGLPTMTIASATRITDEGCYPGSRFVGRIVSSGPYAQLGIAPGTNYLWTDSVAAWAPDSGPSRVLMVPVNPGYPMYWLAIDSVHASMSAGPDPEPMLLASSSKIDACSDGCPSGHCSSSDTWRVYDAARDNPRLRIADDT